MLVAPLGVGCGAENNQAIGAVNAVRDLPQKDAQLLERDAVGVEGLRGSVAVRVVAVGNRVVARVAHAEEEQRAGLP